MLTGIAKKEIKPMIDIQLPIPFEATAWLLRPYSLIVCNLILISNRFVKKEKRGANGKAKAKNAMKPI